MNGLYRALTGKDRNSSYPQFSDHYFTGEYPIKPSDNIKGLKVKQLSLLSGKSNNYLTIETLFFWSKYRTELSIKIGFVFIFVGSLLIFFNSPRTPKLRTKEFLRKIKISLFAINIDLNLTFFFLYLKIQLFFDLYHKSKLFYYFSN